MDDEAVWILLGALAVSVAALAALLIITMTRSGRSRTPGSKEEPREPALLGAIAANILLTAGVILLYPIDNSPEEWATTVAVLVAIVAASGGVGSLLGFIFGVPSANTTTRDPANPTDDPGAYGIANSNLAQVSDWLTRILIGAGLVQLAALPGAFRGLADYLRDNVNGPGADAIIIGLTVYVKSIAALCHI